MIGFELPRFEVDAPVFWHNFKNERITEIIKMGGRNEFEVIEFAIAPYKAKVIVTMTDGAVRDFSQEFFSISLMNVEKYFLAFESEADMLYFKMEWS